MGEVFAGRYELIDPVGRGGVGAVWRAWDHRRRRYVAAKVLQQSDAHTLLRFVREQALRIDHPHVLAPASWAADDDKVLFTMDLVSGGSLAHLIGDYGPLPPRFVCVLLDQLLSGLAAVHAEGVVHRDIKPANILLEATGTARPYLRLSDFGISMRKGEPRLTETNYVVGTPGYFAPEQLTGAEPDFPADLFAVGLVALYLLQGQKPDAKALVELFRARGTPGAPQGIPEPLWQVLAGLLQPDPHARFRTATGARKALTSAAELLPEPDIDDEVVEVFDQIGPLPSSFGPDGPIVEPPQPIRPDSRRPAAPRTAPHAAPLSGPYADPHPHTGSYSGPRADPHTDPRTGGPTGGQAAVPQQPAPPPPTTPATPAPASSMSETGSFHLPPPPDRSQEQPRPAAQPQPPEPQSQQPEPLPQAPAPAQPYPQHPAQPSTPPAPLPTQPVSPLPQPPPDPSEARTAAVRHEQAHTRPYTAQSPQVPHQPKPQPQPQPQHQPQLQPLPQHQPGPHEHAAMRAAAPAPAPAPAHHAPANKPGPPLKVTVPVLLIALVCFAVGFWALTRI